MLKKITYFIIITVFVIITAGCDSSKKSASPYIPVACPETGDSADYDNNYFYLYSDDLSVDNDSDAFYANGLLYTPDWNGKSTSLDSAFDCVADGTMAKRITRGGLQTDWSAGGWNGLDDHPLDISGAANLVFLVTSDELNDPGVLKVPFKVKIESTDAAFDEIDPGFGPAEADGTWKKIVIPLSSFSSVDLTNVKAPFVFVLNDMVVGDSFEIDAIYFDGPVTAPGRIVLDNGSYAEDETEAAISIREPYGGSNRTVAITAENLDTTDSIVINTTLDQNGNIGESLLFSSLPINAGDTIKVSYVDSLGVLREATANIIAAGSLPGDVDGDGKVYIYATNPAVTIDWTSGVEFVYDAWSTGSVHNLAYADADYDPSIEAVQSSGGWGTCVAFMNIGTGIFGNYTQLNFKFKSSDFTSVKIKFPAPVEKEYALSGFTDLGNGWYDVSIDLATEFPDRDNSDQFAIFNHGEGTIYLTDIYFSKP